MNVHQFKSKLETENEALERALLYIFEHTQFPAFQFLEILVQEGLSLKTGPYGPEIKLKDG